MREFDLAAVAAQAWRDLETPDRRVLAKEILERIPVRHQRAALLAALEEYCRRYNQSQRPTAFKPVAGVRNSGRSPKVAAIRHAWPQLRATIYTPDGQKPFGDCTSRDLIFHATMLDRQARQYQRKAAFERELAGVLTARGAETVGQLPDEVLAEYISSSRSG